MESISSLLKARFRDALIQAFGPDFAETDPVLRPSGNPQFGDYQANLAMGLSKLLGKPPRQVAQELTAHLDLTGLAQAPEIAGPGFINLTLDNALLAQALAEPGFLNPKPAVEKTAPPVVVDYSSPNVAKEMHVGHLRSTIIGDAICRVLEATGNPVLRQNHLGDWGTQFGMLIEHILDLGWSPEGAHSISDLNQLYKDAKAKFDQDPAFEQRSRSRVVLLQGGDPQTLGLWQLLIAESKEHFASVYKTLGVLLEEGDYRGESFYNPFLTETVQELEALGLASLSEGAVCAFPQGFKGPEGNPIPLILRKSDGGYGYDTTDMAALRFRIRELGAQRLIYITDSRQMAHFAMCFQTGKEAGWITPEILAQHVYFGSVLGEDGKPFKSRSGDTVKLADLLTEAVDRALAVVQGKNPGMDPVQQKEIARIVGIGAVKYADLSGDRIKDYVFSWDRMLAFDGNTSPYLQNAYVRIRSIFRKAAEAGVPGVNPTGAPGSVGPLVLKETPERTLALKLLQFPDVLEAVARTLELHRLCTWLYELATAYHQFYERCPVLSAPEPETRASRLTLSALVASALERGLELLGIEVVAQM